MKSPRAVILFFLRTLALVLFVSFVSFAMLRSIPGSARDVLQGIEGSDAIAAQSAKNPAQALLAVFADYGAWLFSALRLDFGVSVFTQQKVSAMLLARWKITALLSSASFVLALILSVLCVRALDSDARAARIATRGGLLALMSFTPFTAALLVIVAFTALGIPLPVFYAGGGLARYIAPVAVLSLAQVPLYTLTLLSAVMMVKQSAFVAFAKSQGYSGSWLWWREILPSAALFSLDVAAVQFGYLLGGTVIVESMFSISGVGNLLLRSVLSRDTNVVQALIACTAVLVALVRLLSYAVGRRIEEP